MTQPSVNDFLMGSGAKSASYKLLGAVHEGTITKEPTMVQERDIKTKELKFWKSGDPKWQMVVTIQTNERDPQVPDDDGLRSIYASGKKKQAIADAVRAAGAKGLSVGGYLRVQYVADAPLEQGQLQATKLYQAQYAPPQFPVDQNPQQDGQAQPYQQAPVQQQQQYQAPVQQPQFQAPPQQQFPPQGQAPQGFPPAQQPQFQQPQTQNPAAPQGFPPSQDLAAPVDPWGQPPQAQGGFGGGQQFPPQQAAQPQQQPVQQQAPQGGEVDAAGQQALLNILAQQQAQQG